MRSIIAIAAVLFLSACASSPGEAPARWYLYVPPAPHAEIAPDFSISSWVMQGGYHERDACLEARNALHLNAFQTSQDLAMRAKDGVCFDPSKGLIAR